MLASKNPSITTEYYYLNCELGILIFARILHRVVIRVDRESYECNHEKEPC